MDVIEFKIKECKLFEYRKDLKSLASFIPTALKNKTGNPFAMHGALENNREDIEREVKTVFEYISNKGSKTNYLLILTNKFINYEFSKQRLYHN